MNNRIVIIIVAITAMVALAYYLPSTAEVWIGGIIGVIVASLLASHNLKKRYGRGKGNKNNSSKNNKN